VLYTKEGAVQVFLSRTAQINGSWTEDILSFSIRPTHGLLNITRFAYKYQTKTIKMRKWYWFGAHLKKTHLKFSSNSPSQKRGDFTHFLRRQVVFLS